MSSRALLALAIAATCAGCPGGGDAGSPAARPPVLAGVPAIGGSRIIDTTGTAEAIRVTLLVPAPRDSVAAFYRRVLPARGWRVVGDVVEGGVVTLYAERDGPPLWVRIRDAGAGITQYTLIGAQSPPEPRDSARP